MELIDVNSNEARYLCAIARQKKLQKQTQKDPVIIRELAKLQSKVNKYAKRYGTELLYTMLREPYIVRTYVAGLKYSLDCLTALGQITIYSYPQNSSAKPKLEIHHVNYGFIASWHENECDNIVWKNLCKIGNFNPNDVEVIKTEQKRINSILNSDLTNIMP